MFRTCILIMVFLVCPRALGQAVPHVLPIKGTCGVDVLGNPIWKSGIGGLVCKQKAGLATSIKFKLPPTRGKFRAVNCDRELTDNGNPDDFNTILDSSGSLFWRKQWVRQDTTPIFTTKPLQPDDNDCPMAVSLSAEDTGIQKAVFMYHIIPASGDDLTLKVKMKCASEWSDVDGMGMCRALSGSQVNFKIPVIKDKAVINIVGAACDEFQKLVIKPEDVVKEGGLSYVPAAVDLRIGACPLQIQVKTVGAGAIVEQNAKVLLIGHPRERDELDSPVITGDSKRINVAKPINAGVMALEVYRGGKIAWRSPKYTEDRFISGTDIDLKDATVCATAYNTSSSMSYSCFDTKLLKEVPYGFE